MTTEDISPRYRNLESWSDAEILRALYEGQLAAAAAAGPALEAIANAAAEAVPRLQRGGRLVYAGAGTSGRIAVQDGAELGPTFGWPSDKVAFLMAGGERALVTPAEGAEDSAQDASARIAQLNVGADDVVIGLAASGATPFTLGAVKAGKERGALTIGIANNPGSPLLNACHHPILLDTGPEPIAGSTRLNAATAQKIALNLFSTLTMVRLGRVYRGMMVSLRATNEKLRLRSARMVMSMADVDAATAKAALASADGDVKLAALVARGLTPEAARALLDKHAGDLGRALQEAGG